MSSSSRWIVCAALLALASAAPPLAAQYFGQNKVRYETFDFEVLKTEHFDIYFYEEEREAVEETARLAERWYERLSRVFQHELPPNQPIILYDSHPAFRGTTVIPGFIGETTGGVTEGLRRRVVMPLAGPMKETDHVLGHELVHAFQYDITTSRDPQTGGIPGAAALPLWFIEGMAEYLSLGPVDAHTAMWMRDAVRRDDVPPLQKLNNPKYFPYRYGHAFWAYVAGRSGDEIVGEMLRVGGRAGSVEAAIQSTTGMTIEALSEGWERTLKDEYEPVLNLTTPPDEAAELLLGEEDGPGRINVSPIISPDGRLVAFFSERGLYSIDLYIADASTGEIREKVTETAVDPHFDSLQFVNSSGAWSPDSKLFVYGSVRQGRPALAFYDVERDKITDRIRFKDLGEVFNPTFSPDGRRIAFSAISGGFNDLFVYHLDDERLERLTDDVWAEMHPAWSNDGRWIAFATDRFTSNEAELNFNDLRLALIAPDTRRIEALPAFDTGKHISPYWGPDDSLYFVSDRNGISNVYRLSLETRQIRQLTDLQTGVSGISYLSPAMSVARNASRIVFSVFDEDGYHVYRLDGAERLAGAEPNERLAQLTPAVLPPRDTARGEVATLLRSPQAGLPSGGGFERADYQPSLQLDYIAPPSVSVGLSNFGSLVGGGTALYFSDLLGYHSLMTAFQTMNASEAGNFLNNISAIAAYQNQKHRWTWGAIGGQTPYLSGGYGQRIVDVEGQPVIEENAVRFWQINREVAGIAAYPFNRAQRVEFSTGYRNIAFDAQQTTFFYSAATGQFLGREREDIETPDGLHLGTFATALVYDTSIFGGTSPILGQRYRIEFGGVGGSLTHTNALLDYRRYFQPIRPITFAGRIMHFGRYGGDAEDPRLQPLFLGYTSLIRGYKAQSFTAAECGAALDQTGACPVFDQLLGSRVGVVNVEARVPILGGLGLIRSPGVPPVELAFFYDAGVAWTAADSPKFFGGDRSPVSSYGVSLRANLLGFAIGQVTYAHPNDRPAENWVWEFSLVPGF